MTQTEHAWLQREGPQTTGPAEQDYPALKPRPEAEAADASLTGSSHLIPVLLLTFFGLK